jgi:hypothetical protein
VVSAPGPYCDTPSSCCPHVRRWADRWLCGIDGDGLGRGYVEIHVDPENDRLMARDGCGGIFGDLAEKTASVNQRNCNGNTIFEKKLPRE